MENNSTNEQNNLSHLLRNYIGLFSKQKWIIFGVTLVFFAVVAAWTFTRIKIYQATATVLVESRAPQVLGRRVGEVVDLSTGHFWEHREYKETQVKVIESYRLRKLVTERLNLMSKEEFWNPGKAPTQDIQEAAIAKLSTILKASPIRKSNIIEISVKHANAKLAADIANAVVDVYLEQNLSYKSSSTTGAVKWLADKLDKLKIQLEQAELALHEFKKKNNVISALENKQNILWSRILKLSDALTDTRIKRLNFSAKRNQLKKALRNGDPLATPARAINDDLTVQSLKANLQTVRAKYAGLLQRYGEKHPLVLDQKAKEEIVEKHLAKQIASIAKGIDADYYAVVENEKKLEVELQAAKDRALKLNKREVEYRQLKRDQEKTEKLYTSLLSRMKESELSSQLKFNNLRLLDSARPPDYPISPRVNILLAIGLLIGLLLGFGVAVVFDMLDNSVKSKVDVAEIDGLVYLGMLPKVRNREAKTQSFSADLTVHTDPKSPIAESCRSIRTSLLFAATGRSLRKLVVTSPGPREGKTTTAISVAIAMSQGGSRVLLVDTDMRRPRLHKTFGVPNSEGITSVLLGETELDKVIKTTEIPNLFLLPCGPTPPNPAEICQSAKFKDLIDQLADKFDHVLLDSPPVGIVTDAVILSTLTDGALLVARSSMTSRTGLKEVYRQIADVGSTVLGCVIDDVDLERRSYGYYGSRRYGRYGYTYKYGYSYYGSDDEKSS